MVINDLSKGDVFTVGNSTRTLYKFKCYSQLNRAYLVSKVGSKDIGIKARHFFNAGTVINKLTTP